MSSCYQCVIEYIVGDNPRKADKLIQGRDQNTKLRGSIKARLEFQTKQPKNLPSSWDLFMRKAYDYETNVGLNSS